MANRGGGTKKESRRRLARDPGEIAGSSERRPDGDRQSEAALVFDAELKTYRKHRQELLESKGEFVLIRGEDVAGAFDTYEDALEAGYAKYGLEPFLVKQIHPAEPVQYFTRDVR